MTKNLYSIAICLPNAADAYVREMKEHLYREAGWYASKNSHAHITINVFEADEKLIVNIENQLRAICAGMQAENIHINATGYYDVGAFYLSPDETSVKYLKQLMHGIHRQIKIADQKTSNDPHISIGRQLKPEQMQTAKRLFARRPIDLNFLCDRVCIRKFDAQIKQYRIHKEFLFPDKINDQLAFF